MIISYFETLNLSVIFNSVFRKILLDFKFDIKVIL